MANAILNFHFDYLNTSLKEIETDECRWRWRQWWLPSFIWSHCVSLCLASNKLMKIITGWDRFSARRVIARGFKSEQGNLTRVRILIQLPRSSYEFISLCWFLFETTLIQLSWWAVRPQGTPCGWWLKKPLDYNGFRLDDDGEIDVDGSIYDDDVTPVWVHDDRVVGNYASILHRKRLSRVSGSLLCALDLQYAHIQKKN